MIKNLNLIGLKKLNHFCLMVIMLVQSCHSQSQVVFTDDFENSNLDGWQLSSTEDIKIIESNDEEHGKVLTLIPNGNVSALIADSEKWGALKIEGEMFFPEDVHNYLGFIYNYNKRAEREDFGCLYVKGNGSYIRANPWRDGNVSRLLYEEFKTALKGESAITIGKWQQFKMEVAGNECHLYIGDMNTPQITYDLFEFDKGKVGFQPRVVGGEVWIDNIKVTKINSLSYQSNPIPNISYEPHALLTQWEVLGPLSKPNRTVERSLESDSNTIVIDGKIHNWQSFNTDKRGAVITGRVTEYEGSNTVAYFRTYIEVDQDKTVNIHFTSTDELTLFLNGKDLTRVYRDGYISKTNDWNAWYDFYKNPDHEGRKLKIPLKIGRNQIVIKVRNGQFASGGFFANLEVE